MPYDEGSHSGALERHRNSLFPLDPKLLDVEIVPIAESLERHAINGSPSVEEGFDSLQTYCAPEPWPTYGINDISDHELVTYTDLLEKQLAEATPNVSSNQQDASSKTQQSPHVVNDGQQPGTSAANNTQTSKIRTDFDIYSYRTRICPFCKVEIDKMQLLDVHIQTMHRDSFVHSKKLLNLFQTGGSLKYFTKKEILGVSFYKGDFTSKNIKLISPLLDLIGDEIYFIFKQQLAEKNSFKIKASCVANFVKKTDDAVVYQETDPPPTFQSFAHAVLENGCIQNIINNIASTFDQAMAHFIQNGSGWVIDKIMRIEFNIVKYDSFSAGYRFETPPLLTRKNRVFKNIDNRGSEYDPCHNKCFLWAVLAALNPCTISKKACLADTYAPYRGQVHDEGLTYPIRLEDISKFEILNPNLRITVLGYEIGVNEYEKKEKNRVNGLDSKQVFVELKKKVFPLHMPSQSSSKHTFDIALLLLFSEDVYHHDFHYGLITDIGGFFNNPDTRKKHYCMLCLNSFTCESMLASHKEHCMSLGLQKTLFPQDQFLYFDKYKRTLKIPFIIYADFEAFIVAKNSINGKTLTVAQHEACGFSLLCLDWNQELVFIETYHIPPNEPLNNVSERFVTLLLKKTKELDVRRKKMQAEAEKVMEMSEHAQREFDIAVKTKDRNKLCCFCHKQFTYDDPEKLLSPVRHHLHLPPFEYIGMSHNICNTKAVMAHEYPVVMHNFKGYDSSFIIEGLPKNMVDKVEVIPTSSEKFLSVKFSNVRFIDSLQFLNSSLEKLTLALMKGGTSKFKTTHKVFRSLCEVEEDLLLLFRKGAYPYSYMNCKDRFLETELPSREAFFNDLTNSELDMDTYNNAQLVWEKFHVQNMGEWHDLYVKLDICLLADCFEETRSLMHSVYDLDIAHYYSLPMVAFDGVLKLSKQQLEYIQDIDLHLWLEESIRGGVCGIGGLRSAKANNKYMGSEFNSNRPSTYISYLDANNLYGAALSMPLPIGNFQWVEDSEIECINSSAATWLAGLDNEAPTGYLVEVDLDIPESLHNYFNDYPPAPCKRQIEQVELSCLQHEQIDDLFIENNIWKTVKLVADLKNKTHYKCHFVNLKMYVELGCIIKKIHKVLSFDQKDWMKCFISFNTEMRTKATTTFEKDFWKLLNNAAFGKTIEQKRKRRRVKLATNVETILRSAKKPTWDGVTILNDDTLMITIKPLSVVLDKPIYVGVSCLELSKTIMYDFHYNFMKEKYDSSAKLLYTDTDSLIYLIECEDFYKDMYECRERFDMSEFNEGVFKQFYDGGNKKVIGKFKDEYMNKVVTHFCAAKPKMYALKALQFSGESSSSIESKRAKGINRSALAQQINFNDYVSILEENRKTTATVIGIRKRKHKIYTEKFDKIALNSFDNKRFLVDNVTTLAHGHVDIPSYMHSD